MVRFTTILYKFEQKGEKTGWTYIEIPADLIQTLKPGNRKEFKVKGKLDRHILTRVSVMPIGNGNFILPVNADMRKAIGKIHGATVKVELQVDDSPFVFNSDFLECLADEPTAKAFFETLTPSHQRYFSRWIDSAKTDETKTKRIAMSLTALSKKWGYPEMIRSNKKSREE